MQKEIVDFVTANKIATVCYVKNGLPYCFNCFYTSIQGVEGIVFKSSKSSQHAIDIHDGMPIAGTISLASKSGFDNAGVQFNGKIVIDDKIYRAAERAYYKRFPMALLMPGQYFTIIFDTVKITQTVHGMRSKINWEKP